MWLPWECVRLRAWADELEAAGDVLGDRIKRSLDPPGGASLGLRAKLSLEANRISQGGVGLGLRADEAGHLRWLRHTRSGGAKAALPMLTRALALVPTPVPSGFGEAPPEWRRREWRELVVRLRHL